MGWSKLILVFQAVVTLVLGLVFLFASLSSAFSEMSDSISNIESNIDNAPNPEDTFQRFNTASYILVVVALIELILISRLF